MIIYYNETTKRILCVVEADSPDVEPPKNPGVPLYLDDVQYANVRNDLGSYIIEKNVPVYSANTSVPTPQPPTQEERLHSVEDAITSIIGL